MAEREDILYRPHVSPPVRDRNPLPEEVRIGIEDYYRDQGILPEDRPADAFQAMDTRLAYLQRTADELRARASFLLDKTIDDIDGYIGDAPAHVKAYAGDLTGREFVNKSATDEVYTLSSCEMRCIFRAAGFYEPDKDEAEMIEGIGTMTADALKGKLTNLMNDKHMNLVSYGAKLLILVLKMSLVITIHYTVGYVCGWLKANSLIRTALDVISTFFGFPGLGTITWRATQTVEVMLLGILGYTCRKKGDPPMPCGYEEIGSSWQDKDIRTINCCTTNPIFFGEKDPVTGQIPVTLGPCFEKWVKQELDPTGAGSRTPCSTTNCSDGNMDYTPEERAKAKEVARYLQERPTRNNVMNTSDIHPLSKAIYNANAGAEMAKRSRSALDTSRDYFYTGNKNAPWDCFGYASGLKKDAESTIAENVNAAAGRWMTPGTDNTFVAQGQIQFIFDYMKMIDDAVTTALQAADRVIIGVSNISRWGASRQLCCYVYMIALFASLVQTMIKSNGNICIGMDIGSAVREELRWARDLRANTAVQLLAQILNIIAKIIDVFRQRQNRAIFLAGLKLPLREMWEEIKMVISNGISQYLDILLGPLDQILAGLKGLPEVRAAIANECFGIDKLFDFLQCLLGNLKFGIINWIMQFMDFSLNDFTLIDDIYLCRTKMMFLDALSAMLHRLVNLILGLRDCYDPSNLTNEIVKREVLGQYSNLNSYYEVFDKPEHVKLNDECSKSLMGQSFMHDQEQRDRIVGMEASLSGATVMMGLDGFDEEIIRNTLGADGRAIDLQAFMVPGRDFAEPVSFAEFTLAMEGATGVPATEIEASLRDIWRILTGEGQSNV